MEIIQKGEKENIMNIPINTRLTAWFINNFFNLFEFKALAFYASDETPYGVVMMKGSPKIAIQGISTMISIIAEDTGNSEQEIIQMIANTHPKEL